MHNKQGTIGIIQSNYIPWKGYFDFINSVEQFVLLDDVKYTRGDWRNRNRIKTADGTKWLTIPVQTKGKFHQKISDAKVVDNYWVKNHWHNLTHAYSATPFFKNYREVFEQVYEQAATIERLTSINLLFTKTICRLLDIKTPIYRSGDFEVAEGKNERLISICKQLESRHYISGPAASPYLDPQLFAQEGIDVSFLDYGNYPEYQQVFPPFEHGVTVLDLLFHTGDNAKDYMNSFESHFRISLNSLQSVIA